MTLNLGQESGTMDEMTASVRAMYEQYPYPASPVVNRVGGDVELVLSYGKLRRSAAGPYRVLDAGCGRAVGLLGGATLQPQVQWLGVDISRVSLEQARDEARRRGLRNAAFAEVDLMTLEGLEVPAGGFDVIHSSGVLHHLADPQGGLARLAEVLAPHGIVNLMVYGRHGREPLQRLAAALAGILPEGMPLPERVPLAREAAAVASSHLLAGTRFADTAEVDDTELVDRLLNANETCYDVPHLLSLLEQAGLRFLRWGEPADWDAERLLPDGPLRRRVLALDEPERWRFLEVLFRPQGLELYAAHQANAPRPPLTVADVPGARFRLHPELVVSTGVRHTPTDIRTETLGLVLRKRPPETLAAGPAAAAIVHLAQQPGPQQGRKLVRDLQRQGLAAEAAVAVLLDLERHEVVFRLP